MAWAIGDTVSFVATFRERDGSPATGLSVATVASFAFNRAGQSVSFPSLSSWSEIGSTGSYRATAVVAAAAIYTVIAGSGPPYLDYECREEVITPAQADPAAALSARSLAVASAVATNLTITLVRGDDYLNADGRALAWSVSSPDLIGATVTLTIRTYAGVTVLDKAMTVSGTTVQVDLTAAETAALELGTPKYKYEIVADLAGETTATLATGTVWVVD